mmetsp:Transcript_4951/g.18544  ORF Transcript_4951/g.18544 Transcript_4951/m.18544 type:complete len:100 (-) Transcript_4951:125-424(-)
MPFAQHPRLGASLAASSASENAEVERSHLVVVMSSPKFMYMVVLTLGSFDAYTMSRQRVEDVSTSMVRDQVDTWTNAQIRFEGVVGLMNASRLVGSSAC